MARLVAFLRGINVGGHVVKKEKLKEMFSVMGFRNVMTHRQSGNVIFETPSADFDETTARIEGELRRLLGYDVAVFIRTPAQLRNVAARESLKHGESEGTSLLVTFLPGLTPGPALPLPLTIPKSTAVILAASKSEVFSLTHGGGEGALPNSFLEAKLKVKATTRNMNVIKDIISVTGGAAAERPKT